MKKTILLLLVLTAFATSRVAAQLEKPVIWSQIAIKKNKTEATLYFKAKMKGNWHIYSLNVKGIPAKTNFAFAPSKDFILVGKPKEPKPISKYDKTLKTDLTYFEKEVVFEQKIKLNKAKTTVKGIIEFMACNDRSCLPAEELSFSIPII